MGTNAAFFNTTLGEFITPKVRLAWPTLLAARRIKGDPDSTPRFSVTGLIPADADITALDAALADEAKPKFGAKWKENKKLRIALADTADDEALADYAEEYPHVLRTSAYEDKPPYIFKVEAGKMVPFDGGAGDIYSGRWALLGGILYAYDKVSKGVKFTLNRVILLGHADRLAIKGAGPVNSTAGFEGIDLGEGESASDMFN